MGYVEAYLLDGFWDEETEGYPEGFERRGIYGKRIAASAAPPRNDRESMRPFARGPPGERVRRRTAEKYKNKKQKREL